MPNDSIRAKAEACWRAIEACEHSEDEIDRIESDMLELVAGIAAGEIPIELNISDLPRWKPKILIPENMPHDDERCGWTGLGTCPVCGDEVGRIL